MPRNSWSHTAFSSRKIKSYEHGHKHIGPQGPAEWEKHKIPWPKRSRPDIWFPCIRRRKPSIDPAAGGPPDPHVHPTAQPGEAGGPLYANGALTQRPWDDDITVQLTESIDSMFAGSRPSRPVSPGRSPADSDFIYDVLLYTGGGDKIRRRLVVDFRTDMNIMSDSVYQRLEMKARPYDGAQSIRLSGRDDLKSLGTVVVQWSLIGDNRVYQTQFQVVKGWHMDLVLGRPSVKELQLYRKDAGVVSRLNTSYHS